MTSFEVPLAGFPSLVPTRRENPYPSYGVFPKKYRNAKGAVGESNPRPLPPEGRIIPLDQRPKRKASNEDRTRDLVLTRHMLCQLSYRGEDQNRESALYARPESVPVDKKGLHRFDYGCQALGASNPSLAAAGCFPCSVAGLRRCHPRQCPRHPEPTRRCRWQPRP